MKITRAMKRFFKKLKVLKGKFNLNAEAIRDIYGYCPLARYCVNEGGPSYKYINNVSVSEFKEVCKLSGPDVMKIMEAADGNDYYKKIRHELNKALS